MVGELAPRRTVTALRGSAVMRRHVEARFTDDGTEIHADDGVSTSIYLAPADLVAAIRRFDSATARRGTPTITIIEWINVPAGFVPPDTTRSTP